MNEIDLKIYNTLEYIKANPNCDTSPDCLDRHLVKDLYNKGYIAGINVTHQSSTSPEYRSLNIIPDGEKHLCKLKDKVKYKYFFIKHWKFFLILIITLFGFGVQLFIHFDSKKKATHEHEKIEKNDHK